MNPRVNERVFVGEYGSFKMDIEAAGLAEITDASLGDDGLLVVGYAYRSEGENRKGSMSLRLDGKSGRFDGNWRTVADTGNVYAGGLYFVFAANGEAKGEYTYGGAAYGIAILLVK